MTLILVKAVCFASSTAAFKLPSACPPPAPHRPQDHLPKAPSSILSSVQKCTLPTAPLPAKGLSLEASASTLAVTPTPGDCPGLPLWQAQHSSLLCPCPPSLFPHPRPMLSAIQSEHPAQNLVTQSERSFSFAF